MGLLFLLLIPSLIVAGLVYQSIGRRGDVRRYPPLGRIVNGMHVFESGSGSSAVVLEAGIAASSLSWGLVQPRIAEFARVVSYDRAGLGWSEPVIRPSLAESVQGLRTLLGSAGIQPPYILTGHSYGGLLVRAFAALFPDDVAGLVLVDPVPIGEWAEASEGTLHTLRRGVLFSRRGSLLAQMGLVRFALGRLLSGGNRLPKLIARLSSSAAGEGVASRLVGEVGKLPREYWPMVRAHWSNPKCFRSMAEHLEHLPGNAAQLRVLGCLPDVPVIVISAANATVEEVAEREELARSVSNGRHIRAEKSGHWILFDEPELVVSAVQEVVEAARGR